ncbi:hypothetical protein VPH35_042409 [Triticum aestivum]
MCFEFGSCFGGRTDDYGSERPSCREEHGGGRPLALFLLVVVLVAATRRDRRGNHGTGADSHKPAYHHQPLAVVDEAGHKAYHDGMRKADHAGAGADIGMPKLPAWHNKVGDDAYTARLQEAADTDHRNNAAMDYHHYPSSTTTLGR